MEQSDLALALGVIGNALRSLPIRGLAGIGRRYRRGLRQYVFPPEQIELSGGGGTDMAALIVAAAEERPAPKAILVVTDGFTGWPREPVGPRVVACLTQAGTAEGVPGWIKTVVLNGPDGAYTRLPARTFLQHVCLEKILHAGLACYYQWKVMCV